MNYTIDKSKRTITYNNITFQYDNSIKGTFVVLPKGIKISMDNYIAQLHKNSDRTHYDTPASIRYCSCKSCNDSRKLYGKKIKKGWDKQTIYHHGIIEGTDLSFAQLERIVDNATSIEY